MIRITADGIPFLKALACAMLCLVASSAWALDAAKVRRIEQCTVFPTDCTAGEYDRLMIEVGQSLTEEEAEQARAQEGESFRAKLLALARHRALNARYYEDFDAYNVSCTRCTVNPRDYLKIRYPGVASLFVNEDGRHAFEYYLLSPLRPEARSDLYRVQMIEGVDDVGSDKSILTLRRACISAMAPPRKPGYDETTEFVLAFLHYRTQRGLSALLDCLQAWFDRFDGRIEGIASSYPTKEAIEGMIYDHMTWARLASDHPREGLTDFQKAFLAEVEGLARTVTPLSTGIVTLAPTPPTPSP